VSAADLCDPRAWPVERGHDELSDDLHRLAEAAILAPTRREADAIDSVARDRLATAIADADGNRLARVLASAPSLAVSRHERRLLVEVEKRLTREHATMLFALPVVVVAALDAPEPPAQLPGVLRDPDAFATLLRDARALGGLEAFGLAGALAAVEAIDVAALPALLMRAPRDASRAPLDLPPAPIDVRERAERVHLRFIGGAALRISQSDPFADAAIARWGMPFAQALGRELGAPNVSLLALPRPALPLVAAVQMGRAAQREVSAQVFASNAIRRLRASYGEPTAIISAHRAPDAPGGGELRVSLSSPFAPREAEGFRCPVYPYEAVGDVAQALHALLGDCRLADIRYVPGVHADIDAVTGGRLFFKGDPGDSFH
jgi:hypothetical protein